MWPDNGTDLDFLNFHRGRGRGGRDYRAGRGAADLYRHLRSLGSR